jgi:hypothetical protein
MPWPSRFGKLETAGDRITLVAVNPGADVARPVALKSRTTTDTTGTSPNTSWALLLL